MSHSREECFVIYLKWPNVALRYGESATLHLLTIVLVFYYVIMCYAGLRKLDFITF